MIVRASVVRASRANASGAHAPAKVQASIFTDRTSVIGRVAITRSFS